MAARRLHGLIYTTIAFCCLSIIICGVALGTNEWFRADGVALNSNSNLKVEINYGLFKGKKVIISPGNNNGVYDLRVVCQASDAKCMYSCGTTASKRKEDLENILAEGPLSDVNICRNPEPSFRSEPIVVPYNTTNGAEEPVFLNFALYIMTITFLAIAIAFSALGGGLALYNTYRTPIQPVLSVLGLYLWNAISGAAVILAMIIWGVAFATSLKKNAAVSNTLTGQYSSDGQGKLGVSFWILLLAFIFSIANIGILKYRSWKIIKIEANNVKVMTENLDNGDIILF